MVFVWCLLVPAGVCLLVSASWFLSAGVCLLVSVCWCQSAGVSLLVSVCWCLSAGVCCCLLVFSGVFWFLLVSSRRSSGVFLGGFDEPFGFFPGFSEKVRGGGGRRRRGGGWGEGKTEGSGVFKVFFYTISCFCIGFSWFSGFVKVSIIFNIFAGFWLGLLGVLKGFVKCFPEGLRGVVRVFPVFFSKLFSKCFQGVFRVFSGCLKCFMVFQSVVTVFCVFLYFFTCFHVFS